MNRIGFTYIDRKSIINVAPLLLLFILFAHPFAASANVCDNLFALKDPDPRVRKEAALESGRMKDTRAVVALIELLQDEQLSVSRSAAQALGQIGDNQAVEPLLEAMNDWGMFVVCAEALGAIGDPRALNPLLGRISDQDKKVRLAVVTSLAMIGDSRAVVPIGLTLDDRDLDVREAAARSLGDLADARVIDPLIAAADRAHIRIKPHLIKALLRIGSPAVSPLALALQNRSYSQQQFAGEALSQLGPEGTEVLIEALTDEKKEVRVTAAFYLGWTRNGKAVEPLVHALKDNDYSVRREAAVSLGQLRAHRAVPDLMEMLEILPPPRKKYKGAPVEDFNPVRQAMNEVREQAALALGNIGDKRAVEVLINTLNDEYPRVATASAMALGRIGDLRAVGPMTEILNKHTNAGCSAGVEEALGQIGGQEAEEALTHAMLGGNLIAFRVLKNRGLTQPFFNALTSEHPIIRKQAFLVINKTKDISPLDQQKKDVIINSLYDEDSYIRFLAAQALVRFNIADKKTMGQLLKIIRENGRGRSYAARALVQIGSPVVESMIGLLGDTDHHVRESSAWILGQIGDSRAIGPLIDHMAIDYKASSAALVAIGPPAVEPLIKVLSSKPKKKVFARRLRSSVRYWLLLDNESQKIFIRRRSLPGLGTMRQMAAGVLGRIRDPRAVKPLAEILNCEQETWQLRKKVAEELGKFGPEAVPFLIEALESSSEEVQETAVKVLGHLRDERAVELF